MMFKRPLILALLAIFAFPPTLAHAFLGPETADEVRRRRAQRQLEENQRKQERDALAVELGEMPKIDPALVEDFTEMLAVIADPSMEGRVPGSRGIEQAAEYIESHLVELGLTPAFPKTITPEDSDPDNPTEVIDPYGSYRQPMQMGTHTAAVSSELIVGDTAFTPGDDFSPLAFSGSASVTAPVSFVGYAIVSGPNNYLGFETNATIEGRIALVLNYEPMNADGDSLWREEGWTHNARLTYKVTALQRRGAAGVIIVSPPGANDDRAGTLETIESTAAPSNRMGERSGPEYDIPVVHATPEVATAMLEYLGSDLTLEELTDRANESGIVEELGSDKREINLAVTLERTPRMTDNIGAILPGQGNLKDELVVIGAHYDHVGYGKFGTRRESDRGKLHPGADDNASGTAAVLIAAEHLTRRYQLLADDQDARSILFLWFTAEESGLNGSRFYIQNPIAPIEDHAVMLNMDMVGTLSDGLLEIGGFRSGEGFEELATPHLTQAAIPYSEDVSVGSGRSDHASFDAAGIPALFFFTGLHDRYHAPEDTIEHIDHEGAVRVALLASSMAYDAATSSTR
ncbi:MAG: M20/M25/M40 family metallo-hydrolase, partial [Phycisphaerales bacterium]